MTPLRPWEAVVMRRPVAWRAFGAWTALFPLVIVNAVLRKARGGEWVEAFSILLFTAALVGLGTLFWMQMRSRIILTAREIEVVGIRRMRMSWDEIQSIRSRIWNVQFLSRDGRRLEIDRPRSEFGTFLSLLPNQVGPALQADAERVVKRVRLPEDDV